MPATKYICTNYGVCERAVPGKYLESIDGTAPGCDDTNCSRYLSEVKGGGGRARGGSRNRLLIALVAGLAVVGLALYLLMPTGPDPQKAEQLLSDYFPSLPK